MKKGILMWRIGILLNAALFLFLLMLIMASTAQAAPNVYISSLPGSGVPGSEVRAEVKVDDISDLKAWELRITVDPTLGKIKNFVEGEFLKRDGGFTVTVGPTFTSDGGKVTYAAARTGKGPGVSGSGVLGTVTVTVLKAGMPSINIAYFELRDSNKQEILSSSLTESGHSHTAAPTYLTSSGGYSSGGGGSSNQPTVETPAQTSEAAEGPQLGEIRGRVVNQAGRVIPNATARINGVIVQTDPNGVFAFTLVHPGTYEAHYDAPGYVTQTQELQVARAVITGAPTVILKSAAKASSAKIGKKSTLRGKKGRIKRRSIWWRWRR